MWGLKRLDNLNRSMTSEFWQFTVIIDMVLKLAKCDLNDVKIAIFADNCKNHPAAEPTL